MNTFIVSYDLLNKSIFDYSRLIEYIKSYGTWAKPLESFWIIKTYKSILEVRDEISRQVAVNDKIMVFDVTNKGWASFNLSKEITDWLNQNI